MLTLSKGVVGLKILLIGYTGLLGSVLKKELEKKHKVIGASRHNADVEVDITDTESLKQMYKEVGKVDAVISATGAAHFGPLNEMTPELNDISIDSKLKGQVNLVLLGMEYINDGGSFTLTTGVIMDCPIFEGASSALANGGVKAFAKSAAAEAPRGIRINTVSPNVFEESPDQLKAYFPGFKPVPLKRVSLEYIKSVEGIQTGQSYEIY